MQVSTSKQNCLAARACPVTGVSRIDTASCMAGSAAFQTSSILSDTTARSKQGFLRRPRVSPTASKERTSMVDFQYPPGERQSNTPTILRDDYNVGRVKAGLGCCMRSSDNKGQLVLTGTLVSHKHLRAQSSLSCDPSISQTQDKYINKVATRQYNRIYYINSKGGTRSPELMALTMELWTWCLSRNIYIQAEHLPGVQNCLADKASGTCIDSTDWKIQPKLIKQFLVDRDTDLFATRLTHQLPRYVSWHPDPKAIAADAFSLNWATLRGYAFPRSI